MRAEEQTIEDIVISDVLLDDLNLLPVEDKCKIIEFKRRAP
jgi:hypothetical protein